MPVIRVVLCTIPQNRAEALARALVNNRLSACVNIVPSVKSIYRWEGKICQNVESLLIIKTTEARFPALMEFIKSHHPYAVPEIIALPVSDGNPDYLGWVLEEMRESGG
jgi:periplasmic divalent cation tolerance protein